MRWRTVCRLVVVNAQAKVTVISCGSEWKRHVRASVVR
jgi:hypothetical protein